MSEELKPCHCGYAGALSGMRHSGYLSLACPKCNRTVEAFSMLGLVDNWNKPAKEPEPEHVCSGCGAKGWTGNCLECIPY